MKKQAILYLGLFVDKKDEKKNIRTSADRIAELFKNKGITVITSSDKSKSLFRLLDTATSILRHKKKYSTAIVPLFGTRLSFLWQELMAVLLKMNGKKLILTVNGGSIPEKMDKNPVHFLRALNRADAIICPSGYMYSYLSRYPFKNLFLIENVINLSDYPFKKKDCCKPSIIWMRSFEEAYNPEMAIRVLSILKKKFACINLVMAGKSGNLLPVIKQMAKDRSLENEIVFAGYINMKEKIAYSDTCDIYICTNRIDNAPVSVIEFMALGLPVVSVNTGGIPYMIKDGYNGLLVDLDDDEAMANKIEMLISNPALAHTLSMNGYQYAREYGEDPILKKWQQVFKTIEYDY